MEFYEKNEKEDVINIEKKDEQDKEKNKKCDEELKENFKVEENIKNKKNNKRLLIVSVVSLIILFMVAIFCSIFALINIGNNKLIKGISINRIDVGNLSKEEAMQKMKEKTDRILEYDIKVITNDFEYSIKLSQIELNYNIEEAIEEAYNIGRNKNIFKDNYNIIKTRIKGKNLDLEYSYNEELLNGIIEEIAVKIPGAVIEPSYYIENEKLYISKGVAGNAINKENLKDEILERISNNIDEEIVLELENTEPNNIDIDKIYNEVHTEPKDAYYTKDPFEIFPHVNGIDFDLEKVKELLKEDKNEYEISLIITEPNITTNKIGTEAFPDLLSSFSTKYDASNVPRTTNLKLAMQKLDGVVVNPGETFSYNKTLGKRTAEAGYKEAGGYAGGKVVQTLAGGICQISSTLYDAVVYANLDVVERHNHMFLAGYVGAGKDATVVYGAYDFKFKNTRKYPIMIKTSIGGGVAKISIFGIKEEVEYDVEISTKVLSYNSFKVIYEDDSSLEEGKEIVIQNGMNGCKSITYKILNLNGQQVSSTVLSTDTYDPMNKIIKRGTKKEIQTSIKPEEPVEQPIVEQPVQEQQSIQEQKPVEVQEQETGENKPQETVDSQIENNENSN